MSKMRKIKGFIDSTIGKAIIVGIEIFGEKKSTSLDDSLTELKELSRAAGIEVVYSISQKKNKVEVGTYIGTGKLEEIRGIATRFGADILLVDDELTGIQIRNLEAILDMEIIDRTSLILDIFANRAKSKEGKLQVELARLNYEKPRIVGGSVQLSRQGGGIGTRGLGEKKLELDRRTISKRIKEVERAIEALKKQREIQKNKRRKSHLKTVALIGYTNAGKSTLMNTFLKTNNPIKSRQGSPAKDMLFATLDPFHRRIKLKDNLEFILTDTVGFVSKLPHALVGAFMSTLEEVKDADLLLYIVDISNEEYKHQLKVTRDVVKELRAQDIPYIVVFNKADKVPDEELKKLDCLLEATSFISATTGKGLEGLIGKIESKIIKDYREVELFLPFTNGKIASNILENTKILSHQYTEEGLHIKAILSEFEMQKYNDFLI